MADDASQPGSVISRVLDVSPDEMRELSNAGVLLKTGSNKYNLFGSVRGDIEHLREHNKKAPTQTEIAKHLDMSERNAREVLKTLGIDWTATTLSAIRIAYIRDIREKAAGRSGDEQMSLTRARTKNATADTELKHIQIREKSGELVPVAGIEPQITAMITAARQELLSLPAQLAVEINALHGVDIDPDLIQQRIYDALNHLTRSNFADPAGDDGQGHEGMGSAA